MKRVLRMLRLVWPFRARFAWFLLASLIFASVSGSFALLSKSAAELLGGDPVPDWIAAVFGPLKVRKAFFALLGVTAVLLLAKCALQYVRRYLQAWLTQRVVMNTQNRLAHHLLGLDLEFYHKERSGDLLSRLTNDLAFLGKSVKCACILVTRPLTLLAFLVTIFMINWQLALLGLVAAPIGGYFVGSLSRKMRRASRKAQERRADLTSVMVQFLNGIRIVKAFVCEDFEARQFHDQNRKLFDATMKRERAQSRVRPVVEFVSGISTLAVLAVGGEWVFNGTLRFSDLIGFLTALGMMYAPAKELSRANSDIQVALPGAERVFSILDLRPEVVDGAERLDDFREAIRFEKVSFEYLSGQPVLREIDLEIAKGRCVALVGHSGAGKSTLADLMLRFFDPTGGRVTVDGRDLKTLTFESLRRHIAFVSQDPFLFNGSIRDNIAYGRDDATAGAVEAAARAAGIHDEIRAMAAGYDTVVGERGDNLSGGQRQRVSIARAIFKNAPILILDEATSSLDSASERKVQEALDRLMEGRTSLVIAHRLSTVRHADEIVVLAEGRIMARGTHEELLEASETYANLVQLQSGGAAS